MPLSNISAHLSANPTTLVTATELTTLVHLIVTSTHPTSPIKIDITTTNGSDVTYLALEATLTTADRTKVFPLKPLTLEPGEVLKVRAYGIPVYDWATADWITLPWTSLPFTAQTPIADLHLTIST